MEQLRHAVDERLLACLEDLRAQTERRAREAMPLVEQLRALTMRGGKRLRPAMVVAAAECVEDPKAWWPSLLDACASVELLQSYLLIHDDWIDDDLVRRGGPTVHAALRESFARRTADSVAILAGDMASGLAQELLCAHELPEGRLRKVLGAFATMQREVVLGQTLDVLESTDTDAVHDLKTGSYTVRGPLALGHAVAGGDAASWAVLEAFANPLGIAFQLRDDLIGTFGDEKETGKSSANDLRQGKRTAPVVFTLERLSGEERARFESLLGKDDDDAVREARSRIEAAGAVGHLEGRIAQLRAEALGALERSTLRASGRAYLAGLATLVTDRRK